jgi:hypothetical protein
MHKFKIGQRLFPARSVGLNVTDGAYVVVKRLPERDSEFEYLIMNIDKSDERVVRESQLRPWPVLADEQNLNRLVPAAPRRKTFALAPYLRLTSD